MDCLPRVAKACVLSTSQFYHFTASRMCSLCPIHSCFKDKNLQARSVKTRSLEEISPFIIGLLTTTYFFLETPSLSTTPPAPPAPLWQLLRPVSVTPHPPPAAPVASGWANVFSVSPSKSLEFDESKNLEAQLSNCLIELLNPAKCHRFYQQESGFLPANIGELIIVDQQTQGEFACHQNGAFI